MRDNAPTTMVNRFGFELVLSSKPDIFRSLEKHAPKQNDFSKTIVSSALQIEKSFGVPSSVVIGGALDPAQLSQIGGFFSDSTSIFAYVMTKNQLVKLLQTTTDLPATFVFSSVEKPFAIDSFSMLASSLSKHSEKYGSRHLTFAYEEAKKLERRDQRSSGQSLVIEEKYGKLSVLRPDDGTIKDKIRFFSRGGLDWGKSRDDQAYYDEGWSLASFVLGAKKSNTAAKKIRLESAQFSDSGAAPSIVGMKQAIDGIVEWIADLQRTTNTPEISSVVYCLPSVPVIGWIADRFESQLSRKLRHYTPSLLWGWHPGADFIEFVASESPASTLFIDVEDYPKITATIRYEASDAT